MKPRSFTVGALAVLGLSAPASADGPLLRIVTMPYDDCLSIIEEATQDMDEPVLMADGEGEKTVRINLSDGVVTILCRRADGLMTIAGTVTPASPSLTASR